ncbi:MAG: hypothetical protein ACYCV7_00555 [Acidimicrobiales bacterium]
MTGGSGAGRMRSVATGVAVVVLGPVCLVGCAAPYQLGTPAHRVSIWVAEKAAGGSIGTVEVDIKNVDLAFSQHDPPGEIKTVCALLAYDSGLANGNLPTPDRQLTNDLSTAYTTAYEAGNDCYKGAGGNSKLLGISASDRRSAIAQLSVAVGRIAAMTGRVPSTTTTLPVGSNIAPFGN